MPAPTLPELARTAKRLQTRQPLSNAMFGRGSHTQPAAAVQELKRVPKPGSVTVGLSATRIVHKPKTR
jgi:hypothetical protein